MAWLQLLLALCVPISAPAFTNVWQPRISGDRACFGTSCGGSHARRQALSRYGNGCTRATRPATVRPLSMSLGGGETDRYSWTETDKELNVKVRMPAWAKGKSVILDMTKTHIRLALKEEENSPIIEGELRGAIKLDGSYWTMEILDDFGKMMYVTLEKAPQVSGLGPWMGVVVGEKQVDSDYPEDKKADQIARLVEQGAEEAKGIDSDGPRHTGIVDEDGFCRDLLAVQAMSGAMVARQVPVNGNALFSSVAISKTFLETGEHVDPSSPAVESEAKQLRQQTLDYLTRAYKDNEQIYLQGEMMAARPFVAAQAKANGMVDGDEYLKAMRDDTMWGGGGEVVGLTHVLKRPIHVYELQSTGRRFSLKMIGMFGAPRYSAEKPIHLVCTYSMFPSLDPGSQSTEGNHYVALYPYEDVPAKNQEAV